MTELSLTERIVVAHFEAGEAAPESHLISHLMSCESYSHGGDGWHCARKGLHEEHRNAAGDVRWGVVEP